MDIHIEILVPVGVESLLDYTCCMGLFSVNCDDSERVGQSEDIAL